jgi:hypothetical protein
MKEEMKGATVARAEKEIIFVTSAGQQKQKQNERNKLAEAVIFSCW